MPTAPPPTAPPAPTASLAPTAAPSPTVAPSPTAATPPTATPLQCHFPLPLELLPYSDHVGMRAFFYRLYCGYGIGSDFKLLSNWCYQYTTSFVVLSIHCSQT
ncbi:unnamed protein product [Cuscuta europaea]|uniref:Uncharacterized protein n=1 Tax=Cuscuta europaea TaxID=41803 RepID=A0A9P1E091_CUSEU|nr:unnamed protein product [Cuscuta europaea]